LHPAKTSIHKIEHGVNFVGYIIRPYRRYLRRSILSNLAQTEDKKKITDFGVKYFIEKADTSISDIVKIVEKMLQ
jgi:hypothetical protein